MPTDLHELAARVARLSPPERFRLVADLLEAGAFDLALGIARRATVELGAARLLLRPRPSRPDPREHTALSDEDT